LALLEAIISFGSVYLLMTLVIVLFGEIAILAKVLTGCGLNVSLKLG
jgi:hypothetical protein